MTQATEVTEAREWTHFSVVAETRRLWRITFDSPPVNLVSPEMLTELPRLVDRMAGEPELRVAVFESMNPEYFLTTTTPPGSRRPPRRRARSGTHC